MVLGVAVREHALGSNTRLALFSRPGPRGSTLQHGIDLGHIISTRDDPGCTVIPETWESGDGGRALLQTRMIPVTLNCDAVWHKDH
jgi:hypothetical protein